MRILCCNIRTSTGKDGDNHWTRRKDFCIDVIRSQQPDIVCCQEMQADQFADMCAGLSGFAWFGMIDEPHTLSPVNTIFYRSDAFHRVSAGGYWLSETPHISGSRSWNSDCVRLCNWLRLVETANGKEFRIVNTHLDHISQPAREHQAQLINEDAAAYAPTYAQLLTGDMNCNAQNPALVSFKAAGWQDTDEAVHGTGYAGNTFHGFLGPKYERPEGKIDWIFTRGNVRTHNAAIITASAGGRYPSDHYFLSADITLT
jgi:endonuclease/exonuclease/phosphatase family metal-dependent hydrolase